MDREGTNGEIDHGPVEVRGSSLQQSLATRKVIQLKIDNPFITNGITKLHDIDILV
jgi:hypothetical protein